MKPQGFYRRVDDLAGIYKAPGDVVDYTLDWTDHLAQGVTAVTASWTVPAGLTGAGEGVASPLTTKRISGGTAGTEYKVAVAMTKSNAEVVVRTFVITVATELS
jgi:hypothetical protein